jgi:hypothetical protein
MQETNCNVCGGLSRSIFSALILKKYNADYFECRNCGFIQTEKPYWLTESYQSAITDLDIGLLYRNIQFSEDLESFLSKDVIDPGGRFIDYGGGYGTFVRLMRDKGFDFYRQDIYCQNLFAKHFDISDIETVKKFELLTAFEVFEHLDDPKAELEKMLALSDNIFFSTLLLPSNKPNPDTWWYFAPETGQHISFYTKKSLEIIAQKYNLNFYSNGSSLHMFLKGKLDIAPFNKPQSAGRLQRLLSLLKPDQPIKKRDSLLMKDYDFVRCLINTNKKM